MYEFKLVTCCLWSPAGTPCQVNSMLSNIDKGTQRIINSLLRREYRSNFRSEQNKIGSFAIGLEVFPPNTSTNVFTTVFLTKFFMINLLHIFSFHVLSWCEH